MADGRIVIIALCGGADRPMRNPRSRRRSPAIHAVLLELRDRFYPELRGRPASAEWIGAMGFTPDQLPAIGFLRPGIVVAAGYNGYGGSYTTAAGMAAAQMALARETPGWTPADVFSPRRLLSDEPAFMNEREGLWRIATALCRQLKQVNATITEAVALRSGADRPVRVRRSPKAPPAPRVTTMLQMRAGPASCDRARAVRLALVEVRPAARPVVLRRRSDGTDVGRDLEEAVVRRNGRRQLATGERGD